ncbi:beta-glucosidase 13-like protein [Corchorus olitorius]|uniref:Beta-glucosidase 13-like protein n=1 Tax=Corchorus olitorius TaxID=93759 RepID=A0A1R3GVI6_9ROSI|nr:beta-glucosidase 13-like protein [Corchorus olitorius]
METTVKEIASLKAETLNRLSNWDAYSDSVPKLISDTGSGTPIVIDKERLDFIKCDDMEAFLAWTRALETDGDLETTLMEVKYEVAVELAKILSVIPYL